MKQRKLVVCIKTNEGLSHIRQAWQEFIDTLTPRQLFQSPDWVIASWNAISATEHGEQLYVMVIMDDDAIAGVCPLYITRKKVKGLSLRCLKHLGWYQGDCTTIAAADEAEAWSAVWQFLAQQKDWDLLELEEQVFEFLPEIGSSFDTRFLRISTPDAHRFLVDCAVGHDSYMASLNSKAKSQLKQSVRRLNDLDGDIEYESITDERECEAGLKRYLQLEGASWKGKSNAGITYFSSRTDFYRMIVPKLAQKKQITFYFLKHNNKDIAGTITYHEKCYWYVAQIVFDPNYKSQSPGIALKSHVIEEGFQKKASVIDLLATPIEQGVPRHKKHWSNCIEETYRISLYRAAGPALPIVLGSLLKKKRKRA